MRSIYVKLPVREGVALSISKIHVQTSLVSGIFYFIRFTINRLQMHLKNTFIRKIYKHSGDLNLIALRVATCLKSNQIRSNQNVFSFQPVYNLYIARQGIDPKSRSLY